jgi:CHAT domain-containing protein
MSLAEIQGRMPEHAQILQYAVLNDKILGWVISKTEFSVVEKIIAQEVLSEKVRNYVRLVSSNGESDEDEIRQRSEELFDVLIQPSQRFLQNGKSLYVIPDKALNHLPFAALVARESGRFLLQDYVIAIAPSSNLLVACSEIASARERTTVESLLSVGNPRFDRRAFPSLPDLPSAGREAEKITAYYSPMTTSLLTGDDAREDRVKREMTKSDVIHFALHAVVDEQSPMRSKLLLTEERRRAGAQGADGILQAQEVYSLRLDRPRIVVLSACQTGVERYYGGEGMINMARPFIANGVPLVIVSLWPVEDSEPLVELMVSFHRHRKRGDLSSVEALRHAQLEMLQRPPSSWAAFVAIGGATRF